MTWRYVGASAIGSSHTRAGLPCQDHNEVVVVTNGNGACTLVCVVADGAGSAPNSQVGARIACRSMVESVKVWWLSPTPVLQPDTVRGWIFDASADITSEAELAHLHPKLFACTLVGAVITPTRAAYFQVGDGSIVISDNDSYAPVFWPEETEAANLTYFITDEEWWAHAQITIRESIPSDIAIFTDGLQLLVLDYKSRAAHSPFFEQMFGQLRKCPAETVTNLCEELRRYLGSEPIMARTDDDKSLILATNKEAVEAASGRA